jgi:hypothetical protein
VDAVDGRGGENVIRLSIFFACLVHMTGGRAEKEVENAKNAGERRVSGAGKRFAYGRNAAVPAARREGLVRRNAGCESADPGVPDRGIEWQVLLLLSDVLGIWQVWDLVLCDAMGYAGFCIYHIAENKGLRAGEL